MKKRKHTNGFQLPTEPSEAASSLDDFSVLLHGPKKIGKTQTAAQCDDGDVLFLNCDPPQKAYRLIQQQIPDWETFRECMRQLKLKVKKKKFPYARVVVDGADRWYQLCLRYTCKKLCINHPSDEDWGKGWEALKREFTEAVNFLLDLPCGAWFICHSDFREHETYDGKDVMQLSPTLPGQAEEVLSGLVDAWFAFDYVEHGKRIIILEGSERVNAGQRIDTEQDNHFRCSRSGKKLKYVSAGSNPKEAYDNLVSAFENEYESERPKKKRKKK